MPLLEEIQPSWIEDGWGIQGEQDEYRFDDDLPWDITAWTRDQQTQDQQDFNCCATSGVCCCYCEDASFPGYIASIFCTVSDSAAACAASCFVDPAAPCYTDFHPGETCSYRCPFTPGNPHFTNGTPCPCNGACHLPDGFTCFPLASQIECEFTYGGTYDPSGICTDDTYPGYPCGGDTLGLCCNNAVNTGFGCHASSLTCNDCGGVYVGLHTPGCCGEGETCCEGFGLGSDQCCNDDTEFCCNDAAGNGQCCSNGHFCCPDGPGCCEFGCCMDGGNVVCCPSP